MATLQSHDSNFDKKFRKVLNIIKRSFKIWFFIGLLMTGLFYAQKIDVVKKSTPEIVQNIFWDWYTPPSQKR